MIFRKKSLKNFIFAATETEGEKAVLFLSVSLTKNWRIWKIVFFLQILFFLFLSGFMT